MEDNIYKLFIITEGLKGEIKKEAFITKTITEAKVYFKAYIDKQKGYFTLRQLAMFIGQNIKFCNIWIQNIDTRFKETPSQLKEKYEQCKLADTNKIIETLFEGKKIENI